MRCRPTCTPRQATNTPPVIACQRLSPAAARAREAPRLPNADLGDTVRVLPQRTPSRLALRSHCRVDNRVDVALEFGRIGRAGIVMQHQAAGRCVRLHRVDAGQVTKRLLDLLDAGAAAQGEIPDSDAAGRGGDDSGHGHAHLTIEGILMGDFAGEACEAIIQINENQYCLIGRQARLGCLMERS